VKIVKEILLTQDRVALVDDDMFVELNRYSWCYNKNSKGDKYNGYAIRKSYAPGEARHTIQMHRYVIHAKKGQFVDHIDGNTLNNQRSNLRICTQARNLQNTYKNKHRDHVEYDKDTGKWVSFYQFGLHVYVLGYFDTAAQAHERWNEVLSRQRTG
jgi:hypothetical protein